MDDKKDPAVDNASKKNMDNSKRPLGEFELDAELFELAQRVLKDKFQLWYVYKHYMLPVTTWM